MIGIPIPNNYSMPFEAVKCLMSVDNVVWAEGPYIYANRNLLLEKAKYEKSSIIMIDADMVYTLDDVKRIERHLETKDVVSGLYVVGKEPYPPCVYKRVEGNYQLTEPPKELEEIDACGGGFLGISAKVVQDMPLEAFNDIWEGKVKHGEDISFCHRLKDKGFKLWLDPSIKIGHIRSSVVKPN